jgi:hypothetical protein
MSGSALPITVPSVQKHLHSLVCNPNDPAHFRYYRERLDVYYAPEERGIALAALDALANSDQPQVFGDLLNLVRHRCPEATSESVRDTLNLLSKDHYISRPDATRRYGFRYPIVRQWWKSERG